MAHLAIRGHSTRGKEVIEILEMLGGVNKHNYTADCESLCFYISTSAGIIYYDWSYDTREYVTYTLEEFLKKFPYKIVDKVIIKTLPDYPKTIKFMEWFDDNIHYSFDKETWFGADAIQPYKEETMEDKSNLLQQLKDYFDNTPREIIEKEWHEYDKYNEISPKVNEYLEYVNNIRQNKYPKTYEECCEIFKIEYPYFKTEEDGISASTYKNKLFGALKQLLICRDAYWKIAGEKMGLDKPWEPDWTKDIEKYVIYPYQYLYSIDVENYRNTFLAFPTEEMRDAFFENFKDLIETCKEFL